MPNEKKVVENANLSEEKRPDTKEADLIVARAAAFVAIVDLQRAQNAYDAAVKRVVAIEADVRKD